jgi:hypothetical protein
MKWILKTILIIVLSTSIAYAQISIDDDKKIIDIKDEFISKELVYTNNLYEFGNVKIIPSVNSKTSSLSSFQSNIIKTEKGYSFGLINNTKISSKDLISFSYTIDNKNLIKLSDLVYAEIMQIDCERGQVGCDLIYIYNFTDSLKKSKSKSYDIKRINNGYNITFYGIVEFDFDPTITLTTNNVMNARGTPIDDDKFALVWCDETTDQDKLTLFYTNLTKITQDYVIDSVGGCDYAGTKNKKSIAVTMLNSTRYAVGYYKANVPRGAYFKILSFDGINFTNITKPLVLNTATFASGELDMANFDSNLFAIGYYNYGAGDFYYSIIFANGTIKNNLFLSDTNGAVSTAISLAKINNSNVMVALSDGVNSKIKLFIINSNSTIMSSSDTTWYSSTSKLELDAINTTHFLLSYQDGLNSDILNKIVLLNLSAEGSGSYTSNYGSAFHNFHTEFLNNIPKKAVTSWIHRSGFDYYIYRSTVFLNGTKISEESISTASSTSYVTTVISSKVNEYLSICEGNYILLYQDSNIKTTMVSYYNNGTIWDGNCPSEPAPPSGGCNTTYSSGTFKILGFKKCFMNSSINLKGPALIRDSNLTCQGSFKFTNISIFDIYGNVNFYNCSIGG